MRELVDFSLVAAPKATAPAAPLTSPRQPVIPGAVIGLSWGLHVS